jgi:peptidyl-prolyl cis-trans isomerase A (cyclophilin A)
MLCSGPALATSVIIKTTLGDVNIELFDQEAPETVANFMNYVNDGDFANTIIHRSDPGFVIQGGGFKYVDGAVDPVPADPAVVNEPGISNLRGTIAMAKQSGSPDSATSQWFINLADNSGMLDNDNGGFTVFGQVTGNGMEVIDAIAALEVWTFAPPFAELPLINYNGEDTITDEFLVMSDIMETEDPEIDGFLINSGLNDAWFDINTAGQGFYIVVYPEIEVVSVAWFTFDTERPDDSVNAFLGGPGQRWLTAQGNFAGNIASLDIFSTEGGVFDSAAPQPVSTQDGTMVIEFTDCTAATVTYDIPSVGRQGVIAIQRVALDNVPLCEVLADPVVE